MYLAVRKDSALREALQTTPDGKLVYKGSRLAERGFSEIAVYLSKNYGVNATRWELHAGLVSAAASIPKPPRKKAEIEIEPEYFDAIRGWLERSEPGEENLKITTAAIAKDVDPEGYNKKQRATEMRIATVLRRVGLEPCRIMIDGKRKYRWFPV